MRTRVALAVGIAALVVTAGCDSAPTRPSTVTSVSFVGKSAIPATWDTGQPFSIVGTNPGQVTGGQLSNVGRGFQTLYARIAAPAPLHRIRAEFTLAAPAASRTEGGLVCLAIGDQLITSGGEPKTLDLALHMYITREKWTITVYDGSNHVATPAQSFVDDVEGRPASGTFASPLVNDGRTRYEVQAQISGDVITAQLPDGTTATAKDPRIASYGGPFGFVQVMGDQTQDRAAVVSASAG